MSCQVCHRMICRCGPDLTEASRAKIAGLNSMLQKAVHAFELIACGSLCNPREVAMRALDEIKRMRAETQEANEIAAQSQTGQLLDGLLEIDRCATAIIGGHDAADYAVAVEQAERIGMIVTQTAGIVDACHIIEMGRL